MLRMSDAQALEILTVPLSNLAHLGLECLIQASHLVIYYPQGKRVTHVVPHSLFITP